MSFSFLKKIDSRTPEGSAIILLIAFLVFIHPISTFFGGVLFWIFDRVISTAFFYCIALWLVGKKVEHKLYKSLIAIPVSGIIWAIPLISSLAKVYMHTPDIEYIVREPLTLKSNTYTRIKQNDLKVIFHDPLKPRVQLNMSEGCGCSYFSVDRSNTYNWQLTKKLQVSTGQRPYKNRKIKHLNNYYFKIKSVNSEYHKNISSIVLELYSNDEIIAEFRHSNIPSDIIGKPKGLKQQNWFNIYFLNHAYDMLVTGNYWGKIISPYVPTYFPEEQFEKFLASAVVIKEQKATK